jgi:hypothetical protein
MLRARFPRQALSTREYEVDRLFATKNHFELKGKALAHSNRSDSNNTRKKSLGDRYRSK